MRKPSFFIIGAPKCGTTALYTYLKAHPDIFLPPVKEPNYFSFDMPSIRQSKSLEHYHKLFGSARENQLCGEASTSYLCSDCAVKEIVRYAPDAKLIAMVRNPIDMVISLHGQKIYTFEETETDFATAWELSEARAIGLEVKPTCRAPQQLNYKAMGQLGRQLQRVISTVPREQLHVIVFDDFVTDAGLAFRRVVDFLGVAPDHLDQFRVANARKEHRMPAVSEFMMKPPPILSILKSSLKQRFPAQTKLIGGKIYALNRRNQKRPQVTPEVRQTLAKAFTADVDLLGGLLERDLAHWYRAPTASGPIGEYGRGAGD